MDLYTFSLLLGGAGLAAMGFKGLAPRIGSGHGHHHGHQHAPIKHLGHGRTSLRWLLSPRAIFSVLLGLGLTGLLLDNREWTPRGSSDKRSQRRLTRQVA